MNEELLYYAWSHKQFNSSALISTRNEPIEIVNHGFRNHQSGPDFFNAKIKIGNTLWAGNVEFHIKSSDWNKHKHHLDKTYNNVILHIVYQDDAEIRTEQNTLIPTLELKGRIPKYIYDNYTKLSSSKQRLPCQPFFDQFSSLDVIQCLDRTLTERLENKSNYIKAYWLKSKRNWNETCYYLLAKSFGFKYNADPFEQLVFSLPYLIIQKHRNNPMQIEALLFGQAGMLKDSKHDYQKKLQKEYEFLQKKYDLKPIENYSWKKGGIRPQNSPYIRVAQFAALMQQSEYFFSKILELKTAREMVALMEINVSDYWQTHYQFGKKWKKGNSTIGKKSINNIIINTIVPLLFFYGQAYGENKQKQKSIRILEQLSPEQNTIIDHWKTVNLRPQSAYESQALLELSNQYCIHKKCLNCSLGKKALKNQSHDRKNSSLF